MTRPDAMWPTRPERLVGVTVCTPQPWRDPLGDDFPVEAWIDLEEPDAEEKLLGCVRSWSEYLRGYCGMVWAEGTVRPAERHGRAVLLARSVLVEAT